MKINTTELHEALRTYNAERYTSNVLTLEGIIHEMAHILNCTGNLENWDPEHLVSSAIEKRFTTHRTRNIDEVRASAVTAHVLEKAELLTDDIEEGHILISMESNLYFGLFKLSYGSPEGRARAAKMRALYHRMRNSRRTQMLSKRILSLLQELRVLT